LRGFLTTAQLINGKPEWGMEKKKNPLLSTMCIRRRKTLNPFPYKTPVPKIHARELCPLYAVPKKITTE
jgi:hypothetical protein